MDHRRRNTDFQFEGRSAQLHLRLPPDFLARIDQLAELHARWRTEEVKYALWGHDIRSTLAYLDSPAGAEERGDELEAERERVLDDLREYERLAYRQPDPAMN